MSARSFGVWCGGILLALCTSAIARSEDADGWKVGVGRVKITPEKSMWMAGYASRKKPSEGVAQDLFAKAIAIEDASGKRLVIVTQDLIGVPRALRERLVAAVGEKFQLPPESLLVNASHTHCGPELRVQRVPLEGPPEEVEQRLQLSLDYTEQLYAKLLGVIEQSLQTLAPAKLDYQRARCGFAMNRRRPTEKGFANAPNSDGPVNHDVPVLRVTTPEGKLRAVLFGYACHNTTLGFYFFCGDYAGFAQEYFEAANPDVTALFLNGCGGDQNPYPRSTLELAQQHGRALANSIQAALDTVPRPVRGPLSPRYGETSLEFAPPPTREQLLLAAEGTQEPQRGHAKRLLKQLEESGKIRETYDYPVQVIHFGDDLTLVALAGEVVVDYSLRIPRELAGKRQVWVAGYSNDVFGYVPSLRVLQEGGYEGGEAMLWGSLPGAFTPSVEERIIEKVKSLAP
ncbi:MAG: neutral/alkaline non-lysosomal ceramidase N-terminal domain-containing protein [Pirellulales bacterium]